jgi:hypothetical protein
LQKKSLPVFQLIKRGKQELEKEMAITRIIKKLRNFNYFFKTMAVDEQTKLNIKFSGKNVININSDPGFQCSEDSLSEASNERFISHKEKPTLKSKVSRPKGPLHLKSKAPNPPPPPEMTEVPLRRLLSRYSNLEIEL